jgi:hypothetical protein
MEEKVKKNTGTPRLGGKGPRFSGSHNGKKPLYKPHRVCRGAFYDTVPREPREVRGAAF